MKKQILKIIKDNSDNLTNLREELFLLFNKSKNKSYDQNDSSIEEEEEITGWITLNNVNFLGFDTKEHEKRLFLNETQKVSFLLQSHCKICDDKLPISNFPVRITPLTRQTKTAFKNEFKKQFLNSPYGKQTGLSLNDKLCIKLVFVLNNIRDKDLDNMAKLTLDALKELIKIDDKNIDHLELIKIKTKFLESYIHIRISKSDINTSKNIILKGEHLSWGGLLKLDK
ncbi:RusA family crossover junction endodeoxyribonuclease [Chryseobacterium sp. YIM B08800]|uniref:RusA family crossover junction endodeoxyribonuclease n=1 Tax=Chryseobacterium sp. YIM B08800 TaxID=2984136 RepID=UPI00223FFFE9|nr:RusA family crossover junction endodeoxyribonuclease [Chryseobacterium sp. YIM B08800]